MSSNNKRSRSLAQSVKDVKEEKEIENEYNPQQNFWNMVKQRATVHKQQAMELLNNKKYK